MSKKFGRAKAKNFVFRDDENERDVIVVYAGGRRMGFIEYDVARQFVDRIHDLCDDHETKLRRQRDDP